MCIALCIIVRILCPYVRVRMCVLQEQALRMYCVRGACVCCRRVGVWVGGRGAGVGPSAVGEGCLGRVSGRGAGRGAEPPSEPPAFSLPLAAHLTPAPARRPAALNNECANN
jgi:hypothetical protein